MRKEVLEFWNKPSFKEQQSLISGSVAWAQSEKSADYHRSIIETPEIREYMIAQEAPAVLEIGCGVGRVLGGWPYRCYGVDISPEMLKRATEYLAGSQEKSTLSLTLTDGTTIHLPDEEVNFVYSFLVFQHIQTQKEVLQYISESLRVLKPGGYLRVQTHRGLPVPENKFGGFHGRFYPTVESFAEEFVGPGRDVTSCQTGLGHADWLWVTVRKTP